MLLGAVTNSADIVKELVIQKIDAGLDQMQYANTARKKAMLKKFARIEANQDRINFSNKR